MPQGTRGTNPQYRLTNIDYRSTVDSTMRLLAHTHGRTLAQHLGSSSVLGGVPLVLIHSNLGFHQNTTATPYGRYMCIHKEVLDVM
jgi:hypothetical protein